MSRELTGTCYRPMGGRKESRRIARERAERSIQEEKDRRKQLLKEIEQDHVRHMINIYIYIYGRPWNRKLVSVHKGLEDTESWKYVTNRKQNPTPQELKIEKYLSYTKYDFVREMPIKNEVSFYIIDFYIPKLKLCIEVDGGYHSQGLQQWKDGKRDGYLKSQGYRVLRISNETAFSLKYKEFVAMIEHESTIRPSN